MSARRDIARGKVWVFRAIILLVVLGFFVLFDRIAKRGYNRLAPESGRLAVASLLDKDATSQTGYFIKHPYLYYAYKPNYEAFETRQFNSQGYRSERDYSPTPAPGVLRILTIGGSTTVSFPYAKKPSDTWSGQLETILQQRTGLHVEVINAGLHAATTADNLLHYMFRDRYLKSAIVVLHEGGNDGVTTLFDNYNPEYTHNTHGWRGSSLTPRPFERQWLRKSYLVRILYAHWLKEISLNATLGRDDLSSVTPARALENAKTNDGEGFRRNLDLLVRTIFDDGATPVIFPFVWAPEKVMRTRGQYRGYTDAFLTAFAKDRQTALDVAAAHGLTTVVLPDNAIDPGDFRDFCHVNENGEAVKAQHLADALIPLIAKLNADGRFNAPSDHPATDSTAE